MGLGSGKLSAWKIVTSSGASGGFTALVVTVQGVYGRLYLSKNPHASADSAGVGVLSYWGGGRGLGTPSPMPIDLSLSLASMPSGGVIYHGPLSTGKEFSLSDLTGQSVVQVCSAGFGIGGSVTVVYFRPQSINEPENCRAIGIVKGVGVTAPGASAVQFICDMRITRILGETLESRDYFPMDTRMPSYRAIPHR